MIFKFSLQTQRRLIQTDRQTERMDFWNICATQHQFVSNYKICKLQVLAISSPRYKFLIFTKRFIVPIKILTKYNTNDQ